MQGRDDRAKEIKNLRGRKPVDEAAEKEARSKEQEEYAKSAPNTEAGTNPSSMYELCGKPTTQRHVEELVLTNSSCHP
jgi:hypothetical protein